MAGELVQSERYQRPERVSSSGCPSRPRSRPGVHRRASSDEQRAQHGLAVCGSRSAPRGDRGGRWLPCPPSDVAIDREAASAFGTLSSFAELPPRSLGRVEGGSGSARGEAAKQRILAVAGGQGDGQPVPGPERGLVRPDDRQLLPVVATVGSRPTGAAAGRARAVDVTASTVRCQSRRRQDATHTGRAQRGFLQQESSWLADAPRVAPSITRPRRTSSSRPTSASRSAASDSFSTSWAAARCSRHPGARTSASAGIERRHGRLRPPGTHRASRRRRPEDQRRRHPARPYAEVLARPSGRHLETVRSRRGPRMVATCAWTAQVVVRRGRASAPASGARGAPATAAASAQAEARVRSRESSGARRLVGTHRERSGPRRG